MLCHIRLETGARSHRIAVLCAEKDPLTCHRGILISRHLVALGLDVHHILHDCTAETHEQGVTRLLSELGLATNDSFRHRDELIAIAYARRGDSIAYARPSGVEPEISGVAGE
jgi:hypothetical protein